MSGTHARNWIEGAWQESARGAIATTRNPADGSQVGTFADAGRVEAEAAIGAARRAFDGSSWSRQPRVRAAVLLEMADALEKERQAIAQTYTAENGKPLREAEHEIGVSASELRFYAGLARSTFGRVTETEPALVSMIAREAMGVAGIIVPWNAPLILLVRSLAPALAAGCTSVIKFAPQTALTTGLAVQALLRSPSLPQGVVQAFAETGSEGAKTLVASPDVDVVSYTGSTAIGKAIMADAAGTLKRLNLELGGSAPCIVFADADLDRAIPALARAGMIMAGQQCVAASRIIVHESILAGVRERLTAALAGLKVGRGDDPATQMGPMIDVRSRDRVAALVADAAAQGSVRLAGRVPEGPLARGAFLTPSLVEFETAGHALLQQEIFGPVLTLQPFSREDDALRRANDSRFGLAASVWTQDLQRAQRVAAQVRAGTVWLNMHGRLAAEVETGGYRESGLGRLHGVQGLEEFLQTKHVAWELGEARP